MTRANGIRATSTPPCGDGLCCPSCRGPLAWDGDGLGGRCGACGRPATLRGGGLVDFEPGWTPAAGEILGWSEGFLGLARDHLPGLRLGRPAPPVIEAELEAGGLVEGRGRLTPSGRTVAYHLAEYLRQEGRDGIESFAERSALGPGSRVLDVGCGAGQTLSALCDRPPAERTGVDVNPEALALGTRLLASGDPPVRFVRAPAHALPFPGGSFTHIICRVALNYMRQGPALAEMIRVLRPGGFLYCRTEGPGFDLGLLLGRVGGGRRALGHLRNLFWGAVLATSGWQPAAGRRPFGWDRTFATGHRLGKALRPHCSAIQSAVMGTYLGFPLGVEVVARKRS
jgi:SAM-dependent methyltransferase